MLLTEVLTNITNFYMSTKGESNNYKLSENSKKSTADFQIANQLSSAIYAVFKQLLNQSASRDQYRRLNKRIVKVMNSGPKNFLGQRKLYHGNVGWLKGFRLNPYTIWDSLIHFQPMINVLPVDQIIQIRIPAIRSIDLNVPQRTEKVALQFVCCAVDVDACEVKTYCSAPLMLYPQQGEVVNTAKKLKIHIPEMEGKVLLVLVLIRTYFWGDYDSELNIKADAYLSNDRKYYASEVLESVYVKDGQVVEYAIEETKRTRLMSGLITQVDAEWEDEENNIP